jgi:predicted peptidase
LTITDVFGSAEWAGGRIAAIAVEWKIEIKAIIVRV